MKIDVSLDMFVESTNIAHWLTQYLTGAGEVTTTVNLTSPQIITASIHYALNFTFPTLNYKTAPFPNAQAVLKIPFAAAAVYNTTSTYTAQVALINDIATQY
jgi:hypothetical protein